MNLEGFCVCPDTHIRPQVMACWASLSLCALYLSYMFLTTQYMQEHIIVNHCVLMSCMMCDRMTCDKTCCLSNHFWSSGGKPVL